MTRMDTMILFIFVLSLPSLTAFLLDDKTPLPNNGLTDKHYIVVIDSLHEEKMARQRLEMAVTQLHRQLVEKTENLTDAHAALKLELEHKMGIQKVKNETDTLIQNTTRQKKELQQMYLELRQNHSQLQGDYEQLQREITLLRNDSVLMRKAMTDLEQLKNIDELQTIKTLQINTDTLKRQVHLLSMTQTARGQNFIALYNNTIASKLEFTNDIGKLTINLNETKLQIMHELQRASFKTISEIDTLRNDFNAFTQKYFNDSQQVAITSCAVSSNVNLNAVLKFPNVKYSKGNIDIDIFKTTGTFRCEVPGLYIIAVTMMNYNEGTIYVRQNGSKLTGVYVGAIRGYYTTGSGFVSTYLNIGDNVTITAASLSIYGHYDDSCLTIAKLN